MKRATHTATLLPNGQVLIAGGFFSATAELYTPNSGALTWTQKCPTNNPSARTGSAMAYDAGHSQVVLFGGIDSLGNSLSDTWIWEAMSWTQKLPAMSPPSRQNHAMAYDAARGQIVLFGGINANGPLSDTWVWDGTTWTQWRTT